MKKSKLNKEPEKMEEHELDKDVANPLSNNSEPSFDSGLKKGDKIRAADLQRNALFPVDDGVLGVYTSDSQMHSDDFQRMWREHNRCLNAIESSSVTVNSKGQRTSHLPAGVQTKIAGAFKDRRLRTLHQYVEGGRFRAKASAVLLPLLDAMSSDKVWSLDLVIDELLKTQLIAPNLSLNDNISNIRAACFNTVGIKDLKQSTDKLIEALKPELEILYSLAVYKNKIETNILKEIINDPANKGRYAAKYNKIVQSGE